MSDRLRAALREPLLHFAVAGGLVFAIGRARTDPDAEAEVVRLSAEVRARLGTDPDGSPVEEAEHARRIEAWIEEELLYREALRLGLDRDDPSIRRRLVQKMQFVLRSGEPIPEPSEEELEAFLAEHAARYAGAPRYDFVQVVVPVAEDPQGARAEALLARLQGGDDPDSLGVRVGRSRKFTLDNVAGTFGPALANALPSLELGTWTLVPGDTARTLVRVEQVEQGNTPPLDRVRNRVELDWKAARHQAMVRRGLDALRERYRVEDAP